MSRPASVPVDDLHYDPDLPITAWREEIVDAIAHHQVVIVAGETGSGKTTQLPKMCLEAGRQRIGHTQPRRIAARSVAERIAEELRSEIGALVGYQVRFTRRAGKDTRVKVMTDGVLLNEITYDRELKRYDTIIIDEAHERSLNIDFLLGYLKQLLPRRPELKVIVTSATIDTARFSEHFDDAPVIEVSGRTHPVEVRYRPIRDDGAVEFDEDDEEEDGPSTRSARSESGERKRGRPGAVAEVSEKDQLDAIGDAVLELSTEGDGDILIFLSGEREIRDTADHLASLDLRFTEVIPLYARLSAAEQHRVFSPHSGRRIVLATNVAETSLTVPGIRYVIDAGTARMSRYSARTKVQRLPIEPVSRASANQRAGRCGRVAPGICIRLYSQADFETRPEFTEPEILRTNLASVILQMADARLGDIADFPFVEAPDRTQINDGLRLLDELGALSSGQAGTPELTPVGRQLARMPVDPRLGRMLVEADRQGALREVIAIVAGLSIQDPRERPSEKREQADQLHRRFFSEAGLHPSTPSSLGDRGVGVSLGDRGVGVSLGDRGVGVSLGDRGVGVSLGDRGVGASLGDRGVGGDRSDFLVLLRLWRYVRSQQQELSGNAFRRLCREEFLNYLRIREWQDLVTQLRDVCKELGFHLGDVPAPPERIHAAILAGLLSHVGLADTRNVDPTLPARKRVRLGPQEYLGARGSRFAINRGSALAKNPPPLVMAFELVETNRLWARTVAQIDARTVEEVGAHLIKRNFSEPHWSSKRGAAQAYEKLSLLGVPIVAQRLVDYARVNPAEARAIFIQSALVEGQWNTRHHFFARNQQVRAEAEEMEQRTRRRDITVSDAELAAFYDARIPTDVLSQAHFDKWWREQRRADEFVLDLTLDDVIVGDAADFDVDAFPDDWSAGGHELAINYTFDPGTGHDGVEINVPLDVLNQLDPAAFTWQVPGLRRELATELIRCLPKATRTSFVPAPHFAERALAWLQERPERAKASLPASLGVALQALTGKAVPESQWAPTAVPRHLQPTFVVLDGTTEVGRGGDLGALQTELATRLTRTLTQAARSHARTGATAWIFGHIPQQVELNRVGDPSARSPRSSAKGSQRPGIPEQAERAEGTIVGYPALVDEGKTVGLAVMDTVVRQEASHRKGLRRLVALAIPDPTKWVVSHLTMQTKLGLATSPYPDTPALLADSRLASVGELVARDEVGYATRDELAFVALCDRVRADHADHMRRVVDTAAATLARQQEVERALAALPAGESRADIAEQLKGLVFPGFISATPEPHYTQLPRYLHAVEQRLATLKQNPAKERDALETILELEDAYAALCAAHPEGPLPREVEDIGWALEELRVSLFAQSLGTRLPVSAKRVRSLLAKAGAV